jgi:putative ABC transport system permease protein
MIIFTTVKIAVRALKRNKLRTLLTALGIIIGVGAVIAMVSIGNGAKSQIEAQIASLGQNVLNIMSGNFNRGGVRMGWGSAGTLTRDDYDSIQKETVGLNGLSPEVGANAQVATGNQNSFVSVKGVSADYVDVRSWGVISGANFTENDVRGASKVALIGQTTAQNLFGDADPVGQIVRIKNAPFTIVGLLEKKGSGMGGDQDDVILVPYTSAMKRLTGQTTFFRLLAQAQTADQLIDVQNQIIELLRQRHRISDGKDDDFMVQTQQEIADRFTATSRIMTILLGSVACVSLLVGGIGIMNIMLVSVTERTREIGIRLAVGARSRDILMQFLMEALTLSAVGGILGILLGIGSSRFISAKLSWPTLTSADSVVVAFAFSAAVGIFFGFYPARKASHLDPIEALRYE